MDAIFAMIRFTVYGILIAVFAYGIHYMLTTPNTLPAW